MTPDSCCTTAGLLLPHLDAAYNLARYLTGDEAEAEDAVQLAYLRALHFPHVYGGPGRCALLRIVRNICYGRMRDNLHHEPRALSDHSPDSQSGLVCRFLAELPAHSRELVVLRDLEELTYREISSIVGIPVSTVMSSLTEARQQLQETFSG